MEHTSLIDFINCIELGTKIHICVVFLDKFGNFKTELPKNKVTHSKQFCKYMKSTPNGHSLCVNCRNTVLAKAINDKEGFGGYCINGIYEYCHPVVDNDSVIAVVFIGNMIIKPQYAYSKPIHQYMDTLETRFCEDECKQIASVIDSHIKLLIYEYSDTKSEFNILVNNIKNYIAESMQYDISVAHIADAFSYNEQYIGKLFKKHTGKTIKEYLNSERLKKATDLLKKSTYTIAEISAKTGFNNVTYFNRLFKRYYDMSPSEYRHIK